MCCPGEKSFLKLLWKLQKSPQLTAGVADLNRAQKGAGQSCRVGNPSPGAGWCSEAEEEGLVGWLFILPVMVALWSRPL